MIEVAQSSSRLMEALEKLGEWAGSGAGNGPSGPPSRDLVRAFEDALSGSSGETELSETPGAADTAGAELAPGPAESVPSFDDMGTQAVERKTPVPDAPVAESVELHPEQRPEAVSSAESVGADTRSSGPAEAGFRMEFREGENPVQELGRLLEDFSRPGAVVGPEELFRVQYLVGMLKVQAQAGQQTSQSASQGMESLLRQQG